MKRILSVLISMVLVFCMAGCNGDVDSSPSVIDAATGRYRETDISPPNIGYPLGLFTRDDGSVDYLCQTEVLDSSIAIEERGILHYTLQPGSTQWNQQDTPWVAAVSLEFPFEAGGYCQLDCFMDNGVILLSGSMGASYDGSTYKQDKYGLFIWQNGTLTNFGFVSPQGDNEGYYRFVGISDEYIVVYSNAMMAYCINRSGEVLGQYSENAIDNSAVIIDGKLVRPDGFGKASVMSLPSFSLEKQMDIMQGTTTTSGNALYIMNSGYEIDLDTMEQVTSDRSIYRSTLDGTTIEQLLNGTDYSFGRPGFLCQYMAVGANETFYVVGSEGSSTYLLQYAYDESLSLHGEDSISIFSLYDSPTIRQAISIWTRQHPETTIDYVVGITDAASSLTVDDYITQLVTELVAGQGPDILVLDDLPIENLIHEGFMDDLSAKVSTEGIFESAATAFKINGSTYAIPTRMRISIMGSDNSEIQSALSSLEEVASFVEQHPSSGDVPPNEANPEVAIVYPTAEVVFNTWYPAYANAIWRDNTLDSAAFTEFLTNTGRIISHNGLPTIEEYIEQTSASAPSDASVNSGYLLTDNSTTAFYNGGGQFFTNVPFNTNSFFNGFGEWGGKTSGWIAPMQGSDGAYYQPSCVVGIVSGASDKSSEFINLMLSDEVQKANTLDGSPVRVATFSEQFNVYAEEQSILINSDVVDAIQQLKPVILRQVPMDAARDAALRFYRGEISAEQACAAAAESAAIWIAEQAT